MKKKKIRRLELSKIKIASIQPSSINKTIIGGLNSFTFCCFGKTVSTQMTQTCITVCKKDEKELDI